ncbi:MAG: ATP-dependent zinc protease [Pseudomonadales bacterium]|jgi:hypothetical protein|nr:ATP-dependent zinc protease [Pseudomonadales bacterium]
MTNDTRIVGWREWVRLPALGIPAIKAKVDTGAKTSSLHAFEVNLTESGGREVVTFKIHPLRKRRDVVIECRAPLVDRRVVRDSGGHTEERFVVTSLMTLGPFELETEFTLTSRDDMIFPMLLGRRAISAGNMLVDVNRSYVHGRAKIRDYDRMLLELNQ